MNVLGIQTQSKVIRNLTTGRYDDTMRIFQFKNIHYPFECQFIKVETVAHVIVCRYRFRIIVDHNTAPTFLANGIQSLHTAPVKLYRRTDTVGTGTQYDNGFMVTQIMYIVCHSAIGQIQIIGLRRIFGSQCIDLFYHRKDTGSLTILADIQASIFHITFITDSTGNLEIGKALNFSLAKQFHRQIGNLFMIISPFVHFFRSLHYIHQLLKEPFVNLRQFMHLINGVSCTKGF